MSYDHWKTTDPADEHMRAIVPKSTRLQCAADDAAVIADELESLDTLLDRYYKNHGEELGSQLTYLFPGHGDLLLIARKIAKFAHSLEPVED